MERTLCVWYPEWGLRDQDAPQDEPAQNVGEDGRVIAVNHRADAAGVHIGMRRREAEAVCPTVVTVPYDPGAAARRFEPVVLAIEALIPRVELSAPGLLFIPVDGAVVYYGGEGPLIDRLAKELDSVTGPGFRIGLAAGPFAALRAAEQGDDAQPIFVVADDGRFLASLELDDVGAEELVATLRWLGITTLGELARLPRAAMVSRFGAEGLAAHRLASGEGREPLPRSIPKDLQVEERYSPPLESLDQVAFAARSLANRLIGELAAHGIAPYRVQIEAEAADGTVRSRLWRSIDPFDDGALAERARWQLRAWMEGTGVDIRGGIAALRFLPHELSGSGRQLTLHDDARNAAEAQRAIAEAQAIVGPDAVVMAVEQGGRDPGDRVTWHRWGEPPLSPNRDPAAPWPGKIPAPAPALVPPTPPTLEVEWVDGFPERVRLSSRWVPVLSWAGPWRKMGRWWEGKGPADRYQIVTSAGAILCEVSNGRTVLLGIYD